MDLSAVKNYKVLLMGDSIIDEYYYVTAVGKSMKEGVVSVVLNNKEVWMGGVWAGANHVRNFCEHVDVWVGEHVIHNWKFVQEHNMTKMFSVHEFDSNFDTIGHREIGFYDLVIVADFGHGCMTRELIKKVSVEANFLAVNAQTNSTNFGFNLITRYPSADFVVLDELEARLAAHDRDSPLEEVIRKLGYNRMIVTKGNEGAVGFDLESGFVSHKAIANNVVDTMGAGDAFLCVSAPFACAGFPMESLVRIGNAAGAAKCGIKGHSQSVDATMMEKYL